MYYKEFLRARRAVAIYAIVWAALFVLSSILMLIFPVSGYDEGGQVTRPLEVSWPGLVGYAAFFASIVATVLGSTLAQENDGHLELALTKRYSRGEYATAVMAVDVAAIGVAIVVGLLFVVLHILIFHRTTNVLVAGPDPVFNALRYILFPIAWYAIIVALSARLRGAGIVQGLIWPVAIVLLAAREVPSFGMWRAWHDVLAAINVVNPLAYIAYHRGTPTGTALFAGAGVMPEVSTIALAALIIVAYIGATLQWRRVEA